jgi:hypothetical protein
VAQIQGVSQSTPMLGSMLDECTAAMLYIEFGLRDFGPLKLQHPQRHCSHIPFEMRRSASVFCRCAIQVVQQAHPLGTCFGWRLQRRVT